MSTNGKTRRQPYLEPEVPLCLTCLQPYDPLLHYCPKCGAAVGQLTPYIPFVDIGYYCEFWARLWKRIWSPEPGGIFIRVFGTVIILLFAPILLIGIPFVILNRRRAQIRGFDVLVDAEQKLAASPDDSPPKYSHRPPGKPQ